MLWIILSAIALAASAFWHHSASAENVSVCQDRRGYVYRSNETCKARDRQIDFYRTFKFTRDPTACESAACVIANFHEGRLVLRTSPRHVECWFHFALKPGWDLYSPDAEPGDPSQDILIPRMDSLPVAADLIHFSVGDAEHDPSDDGATIVSYTFGDLFGSADADKCHLETTVHRRRLR
jgi:hypothetical protein